MKKILLIPGNPVIASYYKSWMQEIESKNPDIQMTYATSYVLFDRRLDYVEYDRKMREHYEGILLGMEAEKITIIAHSVGSYFALRLLEKFPEKIGKVIVMFPYIGYSDIPSLAFIGPLYEIDRFFPLAELVSKCKNMFSRWYGDTRGISDYELTACLRFGVRQCAYFNKHKLDTAPLKAHKEKICFVYADDDRWCPKQTIELLVSASDHKRVDLPHDFILTKELRLRMAEEILPYLGNKGE